MLRSKTFRPRSFGSESYIQFVKRGKTMGKPAIREYVLFVRRMALSYKNTNGTSFFALFGEDQVKEYKRVAHVAFS